MGGEVGWLGKEAAIMLRMEGGGEYPPKQRAHFFGRWHLVTGGILVAMGMVGDGVWGGRGQQI